MKSEGRMGRGMKKEEYRDKEEVKKRKARKCPYFVSLSAKNQGRISKMSRRGGGRFF